MALPTSERRTGPELSRRSKNLPASPIRRIFALASQIEESGEEVFRLDIGDPDFILPSRIRDGIVRALAEGETRYSAMAGISALRSALAAHMNRKMGLGIGPQQIVVHQGATQALNAAILMTCGPSRTLLLPEIYWPNYLQQAILGSVRTRFYPLTQEFLPDIGRLRRHFTPGMRALLVNSPANPTGAVHLPRVVRAIYAFAREHNLWILSDEAYVDFVFEGETLSPLQIDSEFPEQERRVVGLYSFSKSFAATGLRMGWSVWPSVEAGQLAGRMNEPLTGSLTTPLQWGMVEALREDDSGQRREALRPRRDLVSAVFRKRGLKISPPAGGLFYFVDVRPTGLSGEEFADQLLREERVAVVPGRGFGLVPTTGEKGGLQFEASSMAERCVRLCFAVPEELLREGVSRFASFFLRRQVSDKRE
ncbi:MAG TPA: pyridoxal phosphate-dependent aminotransferase [Acidobacteriota bacterium]|nr:pyridoxal phosphate-dependent aminotransferase [Acidobacteriota bacterium]